MEQKTEQTTGGALSVNNFCQWAGIGRTAFYAELKAGHLAAKKLGRRTIIPRDEAERWLAELPSQRRSCS